MRMPYRVPFYPDMVGVYLLISRSDGGVLEHVQELHQMLRGDLLVGFPSRILNSVVFPTRVDLFLQRDDSAS
jgi:hypothetical protein